LKQMKVLNILLVLFVSQYMIFVNGKDLTCKVGEVVGRMVTSGKALQVCGLSIITTEAECKAAAEYNRKNNIDKNEGYGGKISGCERGCIYYSVNNKYHFNDYKINRLTECTIGVACICKANVCTACPINTYSEGGINPTCTPCPKERPTTNLKTGQTSINACIPVPPIKCEAGYGFINDGITNENNASDARELHIPLVV
jgi:hypothetical protein